MKLKLALPLFVLLAGPLASAGLPTLPDMGGSGAYAQPGTSAEDLAKLQARIDELMIQVKAMKEGSDRLSTMLDRLLNSTGVRFGGEAVSHSVSFTQFPTAGGSTMAVRRSWPTVGYLDFKISARPHPELSAEVIYRMEKVFGGFWGSLDISGVRRFNIHGDTAIGFDLGVFDYKATPLTVWAPQDEYPFEMDILARKRREGMEQVYLGENTWPLQGIRLDATLLLFNSLDLDLEGIAVRTAIAGTKNTGLAFALLFPYDQYLVGGRAGFSAAGSKAFRLGVSYFEFIESQDTAILPLASNQLRNNIAGSDFAVEAAEGKVKFKVEGALSNYTYAYGKSVTWTTGGAGNASLEVQSSMFRLKVHGLYVDEKFINPAAQTRTHHSNGDFMGQIPTGNNLYDPREGDYNLNTVNNQYFSQYNNVIFATNQNPMIKNNQALGGYLLQPGERNRSLPYGWATPNRAGGGGDIELSLADGMLKPRLLGSAYFEPVLAYWLTDAVGTRNYVTGGGGLTVDLAPALGLPLAITGGWVIEDTKATSIVAYTIQTGSFHLRWQMFKDVHLLSGWQQISAYGLDYPSPGLPLAGVARDQVVTSRAVGLEWALSKASDFYINYVHHDFWLPTTPAATYGAEEFEAKFSLRF